MKSSEFKAWFEGFSEAIEGQPTPAQWERIKKRVSEIDGSPIRYSVYVDRWRPYYPPWTVWNGPIASDGTGTRLLPDCISNAVSYSMMAAADRKGSSDLQ